MLILLPPSEGKAEGGSGPSFASAHSDWLGDTQRVLKHEKKLKRAERKTFYGAKDLDKAAEYHKLNQRALEAGTLPAIERYTGVVYQFIDYEKLKKKAAAKKRICVVSGLFGFIRADTNIPLYKMPMNPWLTRYWKDINTERLAQAAKGKRVLSLLSSSYAKAINLNDPLTVDFRVQGGKKSAGHFGKAIKGKFVRFLIENNVRSESAFGDFSEDGYRYDGTNFIQD